MNTEPKKRRRREGGNAGQAGRLPKDQAYLSLRMPKRMEALTPEQLEYLNQYMLSAGPMDKLSQKVKEEYAVFADMSQESVRQMLFRYKARFVVPKQAVLAAKMTGGNAAVRLAAVTREMERTINPLKELETVVFTQMERVAKLAKLESKMPSLMDAQTKNVALLADLLSKFATLKMDVGEMLRVPKKLAIATVDVSKEEVEFMERAKAVDSKAQVYKGMLSYVRQLGVMDLEVESDTNDPAQ